MSDKCPNCGYCPTCGRSNTPPQADWTYRPTPTWPYWQPFYVTWGDTSTAAPPPITYTTTIGGFSLSFTN
jgi:hypothetical protein